MNELGFIQKEQVFTTSLKIAEVFEKRHKDVLRAIENAIAPLKNIAESNERKIAPSKIERAFVKGEYKDASGKSNPMYYLNRDAFSFVVMGFTGAKAVEWKWNYIQAFNAMESRLTELLAERKSAEYIETRKSTKRGQRALTKVIQNKTIPNAKLRGSKCDEKFFYSNVNRWINQKLGIGSKMRDTLPLVKLHDLEVMQAIAASVYDTESDKGTPIHETNLRIKQAFEKYSEVAFIAQRYLLE